MAGVCSSAIRRLANDAVFAGQKAEEKLHVRRLAAVASQRDRGSDQEKQKSRPNGRHPLSRGKQSRSPMTSRTLGVRNPNRTGPARRRKIPHPAKNRDDARQAWLRAKGLPASAPMKENIEEQPWITGARTRIFLFSFTLLFFELLCIRWIPAYVRYL